jgi:alpha-1,2-mannosyltransferase
MFVGFVTLAVVISATIVASAILKVRLTKRRNTHTLTSRSVGFVHPDAFGGGGGERVLWVALQALQESDIEKSIERRYVLYCSALPAKYETDAVKADVSCFKHPVQVVAEKQFGIRLRRRVEVVQLHRLSGSAQDPKHYPRLTILLQSFVGGLLLGLDVCRLGPTEVLIDSVGIAFAYPIYKLIAGSHVIAYVHYPTVSTDMMGRVEKGTHTYNNDARVAKSRLLTTVKLWYYRSFAILYGFVGRFADVAVTNSSWTNNHVEKIWSRKAPIVFPPVNVAVFASFPLENREPIIVSIGQFRPEKNHLMQVEAFAKAAPNLPPTAKLILVGGARNAEDQRRVDTIHQRIAELKMTDRILVEVSVPFTRITELLRTAAVGLHTMLDEHFGIVVVEYLAAGCVALAHNSGGVKADIVDPMENGILAATVDEFADGMITLMNLHALERADQSKAESSAEGVWKPKPSLLPVSFRQMQEAGRRKSQKFSDAHFGESFLAQSKSVLI